MKIFDCFTFFDEFELLEVRLNELKDVVDAFVLVEATRTHKGDPKPLYETEIATIANKVLRDPVYLRYIVDRDMPAGDDPWAREKHQRDAIVQGLWGTEPEDLVIVSDVDEIPRRSVVEKLRSSVFWSPRSLGMRLSYYKLNWLAPQQPWRQAYVTDVETLRKVGATELRRRSREGWYQGIADAGWHVAYAKSPEKIVDKIKAFAHQEFATPEFLDAERMRERIALGVDPYSRGPLRYAPEVDGPAAAPEEWFLKLSESDEVRLRYRRACETPSDINEHLPTLREYAGRAGRITEMGVRNAVSSWALLAGAPALMRSYDIVRSPEVDDLVRLGSAVCDFKFLQEDTRTAVIAETDLLFIDTLHTYAQLKIELARHAPKVRKWIILHDTETFGERGEDGSMPGLNQAVRELCAGGEWGIAEHFKNNNGLTVLTRLR